MKCLKTLRNILNVVLESFPIREGRSQSQIFVGILEIIYTRRFESVYTVKLANSDSPFKFNQVKFHNKLVLRMIELCCFFLTWSIIFSYILFLKKTHFIILKTNLLWGFCLAELANLTVPFSPLWTFELWTDWPNWSLF